MRKEICGIKIGDSVKVKGKDGVPSGDIMVVRTVISGLADVSCVGGGVMCALDACSLAVIDEDVMGQLGGKFKHGDIVMYNPETTDEENLLELTAEVLFCDKDGIVAEFSDGDVSFEDASEVILKSDL